MHRESERWRVPQVSLIPTDCNQSYNVSVELAKDHSDTGEGADVKGWVPSSCEAKDRERELRISDERSGPQLKGMGASAEG